MDKKFNIFTRTPEQKMKLREQRVHDLTESLLNNNNTVDYPVNLTKEDVNEWYEDYQKALEQADKIRTTQNEDKTI